jgi:hypothetical protein
MKAYCVSIRDDEDQGMLIVFANTRNEARNQSGDLMYESWIDIRAIRDKRYDGLEKLSDAQLALRQWHDGWRWYDMDYPEPEEATDAQFLEWYERNFS